VLFLLTPLADGHRYMAQNSSFRHDGPIPAEHITTRHSLTSDDGQQSSRSGYGVPTPATET
jgi:hypothetical protein